MIANASKFLHGLCGEPVRLVITRDGDRATVWTTMVQDGGGFDCLRSPLDRIGRLTTNPAKAVGMKCILLPRSAQAVIDRARNGSSLKVKTLRVVKESQSGKSLLCEVAEWVPDLYALEFHSDVARILYGKGNDAEKVAKALSESRGANTAEVAKALYEAFNMTIDDVARVIRNVFSLPVPTIAASLVFGCDVSIGDAKAALMEGLGISEREAAEAVAVTIMPRVAVAATVDGK
jgi:hypothetical protein